jgi:hypothetical protein
MSNPRQQTKTQKFEDITSVSRHIYHMNRAVHDRLTVRAFLRHRLFSKKYICDTCGGFPGIRNNLFSTETMSCHIEMRRFLLEFIDVYSWLLSHCL